MIGALAPWSPFLLPVCVCVCACVCAWMRACMHACMCGFWKTNQNVTLGLFHFINHTHTLATHTLLYYQA